MKYLLCILALLTGTACSRAEREADPKARITEYYDVSGLLRRQMRELAKTDAQLIKDVSYIDQDERDTLHLVGPQIRQELRMFTEMDINRAVLSGRYSISTSQEGGYEVTRYQADEPEELQVNYLEVYRQGDEVRRLEALFSDRNLLYNSTRTLTMTLTEEELPLSYSIVGIQKMIFRDSVAYSIQGQFVYDK
ncbi:hypothetical protein [Cesiribacter andamanensis]|uniref:Uncharacterized protein n=1 Tax=Cesiribacter andamanensis AMV16 TaxID=1279009 RepID=M7NSN8_9BACT|nr:hypothetical protein [Cesiribacter andamanensis]EMR04705.1 hypothetical protein ADICEAN_00157 [Cesiribacter andamanensis AMV16]